MVPIALSGKLLDEPLNMEEVDDAIALAAEFAAACAHEAPSPPVR